MFIANTASPQDMPEYVIDGSERILVKTRKPNNSC